MPSASFNRLAGSIVSSATRRPRSAAASASAADTVVLPTPPPPRQRTIFFCWRSASILCMRDLLRPRRGLVERGDEAAEMRAVERRVDDERNLDRLDAELALETGELLLGASSLLDVVTAGGDPRIGGIGGGVHEPARLVRAEALGPDRVDDDRSDRDRSAAREP